jgi:hypothetical protein
MAAIKLRQIEKCGKVGGGFVRQGICAHDLGCTTIQLAGYGNEMDVA